MSAIVQPPVLEHPIPNGTIEGALQREITCETILVTPEMALKWLEGCPFDYQRNLAQWHVDALAEAMKRGEFEVTPIKFYRWQGRDHLVDGQHRLNAIVKSNKPQALVVVRQRAESWNQVLKAYGRLDRGKGRTMLEGMYAARIHEAAGLSLTETNATIAALKVLMAGFSGQRCGPASRNNDSMARGVLQWHKEARDYFAAIEDASAGFRRKLSRAPVMAVGLITFRWKEEKAAEFWMRAATRDRIEANSGEWWVGDVLGSRDLADFADISRRMASCWNAYYKGRKLTHILVKDTKTPIVIAGSPYTSNRVIREVF